MKVHINIVFLDSDDGRSCYEDMKKVLGKADSGYNKNYGEFSHYWCSVKQQKLIKILENLFNNEAIVGWTIESEDKTP